MRGHHLGVLIFTARFIVVFVKVCIIVTVFAFMWPFGLIHLINRNRHHVPALPRPSPQAKGLWLFALDSALQREHKPRSFITEPVSVRRNAPRSQEELPRDLFDTIRGLQQLGIQRSRAERLAREAWEVVGSGAGLSKLMSYALKQHGSA